MLKRRRTLLVGALGLSATLALAACSGSDSGSSGKSSDGGSGKSASKLSFLAINENETIPTTLTTLSKDECKAQDAAQPLEITKQAQSTLDQQLQLLAGQDALPQLFISANAPSLNAQLAEQGTLQDAGEALKTLGISDSVLPAATSVIENLYDGKQLVLPTELNIEGIWYNKKILADNGIEVPATWTELTDAFAKLKAAGIQPISQAGKGGDGWGVTRWVGNYIARDLGATALQDVRDGKAKLTDSEYVKAADAIADLGKQGYFGQSPTSIDYTTALNTFLTGDAAFIYMGSWAVSNFSDETQNKVGADNIGFMHFPAVDGGKGSADQMPANVGTAVAISAKGFKDTATQDWVKCIAANYGTVALRDSGQVTGFEVSGDTNVAPLSQLVQDEIGKTKESILWFEAYFSPQATTTSQNDGGLLGSGQLSGEEFMKQVQASLGS
ncbi:ABC transporter substrate-binding protein [Cellulomonas sp. URHD0024]|uniref:ABC transporter substrate-binding protein n=1 Tax=Cellulomonas sp. URHD0024 TaxID=1302620 RepID=UPI000687F5AC|nr:extracellular solute-binding protein [Cellulomonas sp. URHD0024]